MLSVFDGRTWSSAQTRYSSRFQAPAELQVQGDPVRYEITLQPTLRPWLLLLDAARAPPQLAGQEVRMAPTCSGSRSSRSPNSCVTRRKATRAFAMVRCATLPACRWTWTCQRA
ncbi:MAG: transglutaminaseTgpA domain-containing protein [Betaproteobacteria bacterium]